MYYKLKLNRADILFSKYIRQKAGWRCEYCHILCKIGDVWVRKLEASHYFVRSHWSTRYDPENVHALCFSCHKRMGEYKRSEDGEYDLWMKKLLGEKGYQALKIRANWGGMNYRRDDKLSLMYVKGLLKQLQTDE